jgi:hypothetical protein
MLFAPFMTFHFIYSRYLHLMYTEVKFKNKENMRPKNNLMKFFEHFTRDGQKYPLLYKFNKYNIKRSKALYRC